MIMTQQINNFGRFYSAIRALNPIGDRDEFKCQIVWQYTNGRTDSLREMTRDEYDRCCTDLERKSGLRDQLRKERSATLKLMQKAGLDTTDWNRVNAFCLDPRIAGKEFARLTIGEHAQLRRKIRAIDGKGGFAPAVYRSRPAQPENTKKRVTIINIGPTTGQA